ncbi:hypothetical protein RIB2604_01200450 [Aspergillus luchuensis]|uniref:Uncharacterized protein n=1 Tax=Aspergillus kawachii TaxID=1069201 RepID=A0A146F7C6_ASPKA|nr:hypothetical protein RIB2604_01200450 [Aspergillus luchuensis]
MILSSSLLALSARLSQALFTPWDSLAFPEENMRNKRSTEDATLLTVLIARFCSQACQDPDTLLKNLTAPDVKSWFDWIEENFSGSIKAHSALANYWRTLKRLYFIKNHQEMEPNMQTDCRNVSVPVRNWLGGLTNAAV